MDDELLKWAQNQTRGYSGVDIKRFDCNSFGDGLAFAALLDSIQPGCMQFASIDPENKKENLTKAFEAAQKLLGVSSVLNVDDLISGACGESDIRAFVAEIHEKSLNVSSRANEDDELLDWVRKQTKGYSGVDVKNFDSSFENGLAFAAILDSVQPGCLEYAKLDANNKKENLLLSFGVAEKNFGVPKILNAASVSSGNCSSDDIRAYVAVLREHSSSRGIPTTTDQISDRALLQWVQRQTQGYGGMKINDFDCKTFSNGLAFAALIHSMNPSAIDFSSLDSNESSQNLELIFSIMEQVFGIPRTITSTHLLQNNVSRADLISYIRNMYYKIYLAQPNSYGTNVVLQNVHPRNYILSYSFGDVSISGEILLLSRWKLKNGMTEDLLSRLQKLAIQVQENEPDTIMYRVHTQSRAPLDTYFMPIIPQPNPIALSIQKEIFFVEIYKNVEAYSAHVRGPVFNQFRQETLQYFEEDPMIEGWPVMATTFLSLQSGFMRIDDN